MNRSEVKEYIRQRQGGEPDHQMSGGYFRQSVSPDVIVDAEYDYYTKGGKPYMRKVRMFPKAFFQKHWTNDRWEWGAPEGPKIPYMLPELINAAPDAPILICEGEKDVETVVELGLIATCSPGAWAGELNRWFEGRRLIYVLQDNDKAGRDHAQKIARNLDHLVDDLRIVTFEDLPEKGDVTDWIEQGGTKEALLARCAASPRFGNTAIHVRAGALVEIVDQAQQGLLRAAVPIYQRGGELVRPIQLDKVASDNGGVRRAMGAMVLTRVNETWLLEQFARNMDWYRIKNHAGRSSERIIVDPSLKHARSLLGRAGEWDFHVLRGLLTAPTLDRDGRIIEEPGYDTASGMLLDFAPGHYPPIPKQPSKADACAALQRFTNKHDGILRGFPFDTDAHMSVAMSALLTALVRTSIDTAPLHAFDAPTAGTGKSMLAEMAGLLVTGMRPAAMSQGKSPEEDEKRLSTVLHSGDPVILIDNCERAVDGDFLCSMLTSKSVQARILGLSERRILPCTATVLATGNNLTLMGDVSRRAIICRLDAKVERPDARKFDFDAQQELLADRPALVVAALTALRAYKISNEVVSLTPMGSFKDWDWIRGTLRWCGYADPADTRSAILDADPRKGELLEIMDRWSATFADAFVSVSDISIRPGADGIRQALANVTGRNGVWNAKSVGWWLRRHKDRVIGGRVFRRDADGSRWKLEGGVM